VTRKTQNPASAPAPAAEAEAAPASEASTEATAAEEEPTPTDPVGEPVVEPIGEVAADVAATDAAAAEPVAEAGADPIVEAPAPAAEAEDPIRAEALAIAEELDAQGETDPAFITHLLMEHPDGGTTDSYDVDETTGHYLVPVDDIALLQSHGFKVVGQPGG